MYIPTDRMRILSCPAALGRVVIADADESAYAMVRQLTAPDQWEIQDVGTPEALLAALHDGPVRLAIVNLSMLDSELEEELIARSRRGLRVVITSDEHNEANERRARLAGAVFYAPKPLHIAVLRQVLEGVLKVAV